MLRARLPQPLSLSTFHPLTPPPFFFSLIPGACLNDEVINTCIAIILEEAELGRGVNPLSGQHPPGASLRRKNRSSGAASPSGAWNTLSSTAAPPRLGSSGLLRAPAQSLPPRVYCHNTMFLPRLMGYNSTGSYDYDGMRYWSESLVKRGFADPLGAHDIVFFPVHLKAAHHWALAALDINGHALHYFDSALPSNSDIYGVGPQLESILRWVVDESKQRLGEVVDTSTWTTTLHGRMQGVPGQMNDKDCGLFTLSFLGHIASGSVGWDFMELDMVFRRYWYASVILVSHDFSLQPVVADIPMAGGAAGGAPVATDDDSADAAALADIQATAALAAALAAGVASASPAAADAIAASPSSPLPPLAASSAAFPAAAAAATVAAEASSPPPPPASQQQEQQLAAATGAALLSTGAAPEATEAPAAPQPSAILPEPQARTQAAISQAAPAPSAPGASQHTTAATEERRRGPPRAAAVRASAEGAAQAAVAAIRAAGRGQGKK